MSRRPAILVLAVMAPPGGGENRPDAGGGAAGAGLWQPTSRCRHRWSRRRRSRRTELSAGPRAACRRPNGDPAQTACARGQLGLWADGPGGSPVTQDRAGDDWPWPAGANWRHRHCHRQRPLRPRWRRNFRAATLADNGERRPVYGPRPPPPSASTSAYRPTYSPPVPAIAPPPN